MQRRATYARAMQVCVRADEEGGEGQYVRDHAKLIYVSFKSSVLSLPAVHMLSKDEWFVTEL